MNAQSVSAVVSASILSVMACSENDAARTTRVNATGGVGAAAVGATGGIGSNRATITSAELGGKGSTIASTTLGGSASAITSAALGGKTSTLSTSTGGSRNDNTVGGLGGLATSAARTSASTAGVGGSTASSVFRPFADTSPWNTPIGTNPTLDANTVALIADLETRSAYGEHLDVNIEGYSIPLFWADAGTPRVKVTCRVGGVGFTGDNGMDASAQVPLPTGAAPDPESDHHLLIVDRSTNTEYGMWDFTGTNGNYTCGLGATLDLNGSGVRPLADVANPWWEAHGPRACGFGLIAGLIRPDEIRAGVIEHALVIAYPHIRSGFFVSPASTAQATNGSGAEPNRGIPCGGRIQYDPDIDVESLPLSAAGKTIVRALQIYGAYVGDYSGAISLYADNSPEAQAYWRSIDFDSYELMDVIDLADFRVLELGAFHDNGNG